MATIKYIQNRIEGKKKEISKLEKKLERIRKVESQGWEDPNPYYYSESDLRYCLKDLEAARKALKDYEDQLVSETEKANSRDVQVILDFLEMWKNRVRKYYMISLEEYFRDKAIVRNAYNRYSNCHYGSPEYYDAKENYEELRKEFDIDCHGEYEQKEALNRWGKVEKYSVKVSNGKYEYLKPYNNERSLEEAAAKLNKDLDEEATRKYDFIIERTNKIVGQITDASNLTIGEKDDMNGFIIGTKGVAKVQTIGAGGYNIQCFHFRTLINPMK